MAIHLSSCQAKGPTSRKARQQQSERHAKQGSSSRYVTQRWVGYGKQKQGGGVDEGGWRVLPGSSGFFFGPVRVRCWQSQYQNTEWTNVCQMSNLSAHMTARWHHHPSRDNLPGPLPEYVCGGGGGQRQVGREGRRSHWPPIGFTVWGRPVTPLFVTAEEVAETQGGAPGER